MKLYHNRITNLPKSIINLKSLRDLDLRGNLIKTLSNISVPTLRCMLFDVNYLTPKGKNLYEEGKDEELLEYYRRSPKQLALDYISDPNSLTKDELERLIYEIDKKDEKILENSLPVDDPVLNKILERDSLELSNGFKIYL